MAFHFTGIKFKITLLLITLAQIIPSKAEAKKRKSVSDLVKNPLTSMELLTGMHIFAQAKIKNKTKEDNDFQCLQDIIYYARNLENNTKWAIQMLDSSGRIVPGYTHARYYAIGNYDLCVSSKGSYTDKEGKLNYIKPQYCNTWHILNASEYIDIGIGKHYFPRNWDFCYPESCKDSMKLLLFRAGVQIIDKAEYLAIKNICHVDRDTQPRTIGVLCMFAFILLVVIIGTLLDLYFEYYPKRSSNQELIMSTGHYNSAYSSDVKIDQANENTNRTVKTIEQTDKKENQHSKVVRILLSFSVWTNGKRVLDGKLPKGALGCVNGIRVFSFMWVSMGHCEAVLGLFTGNIYDWKKDHIKLWTYQALNNYTFCVDSFLLLGGMLVAYVTLRELKRNEGKKNWLMFYIHRYIRLTPVYMILLGLYVACTPYITDCALCLQEGIEDKFCEPNWWGNLLYVQNIVEFKKPCMGWAWYLAMDFQFYALSPLIIAPLFYKPILGYISALLFWLATTITPWVLTAKRYYGTQVTFLDGHSDRKPMTDHGREHFYYMAPYCRMGPYIVGILLGYIFYRTDKNVKITKKYNMVGWAVATAMALALLYGQADYVMADPQEGIPVHLGAFYNAFSRTGWGLALGWVVFSCVNGYGGFVNSFLSWSPFIVLARFTYCAYLIHPIFYAVQGMLTLEGMNMFTNVSFSIAFTANIAFTFVFAFVASLLFEVPVLGVEKVIFNKH